MIIKVLASGSKGNSTLIKTKQTNILIDVGLNLKNLKCRLDNTNIEDIDAIIITHSHSDHIKGLSTIEKKYNIKVYDINNIDEIELKDIKVTHFHLSHDVPCIGLLLENDNKSLVYITDTGYISNKIKNITKNKDIYIIESNHDETMLLEGKYPLCLKQRIINDEGHLSNKASSKYIKEVIGDKTKYIILAHLSEENNDPDLAYNNMLNKINNQEITIYVAKQEHSLEEIKI